MHTASPAQHTAAHSHLQCVVCRVPALLRASAALPPSASQLPPALHAASPVLWQQGEPVLPLPADTKVTIVSNSPLTTALLAIHAAPTSTVV
jgi:hypothetical protein